VAEMGIHLHASVGEAGIMQRPAGHGSFDALVEQKGFAGAAAAGDCQSGGGGGNERGGGLFFIFFGVEDWSLTKTTFFFPSAGTLMRMFLVRLDRTRPVGSRNSIVASCEPGGSVMVANVR